MHIYFRYFSDGMDETNCTTLTNEFQNASSLIRIILLALTMFSLSSITILGNTIVIYALRTNRHLRTVILLIYSSEIRLSSLDEVLPSQTFPRKIGSTYSTLQFVLIKHTKLIFLFIIPSKDGE